MRVFLDSSMLYAAVKSPTGNAGEIIKEASKQKLTIIITKAVFNETARNLKKKEGDESFFKFFWTLALAEREIIDDPSSEEESRWNGITADKDCHVLAGALKAHADVLVTLDRKDLHTDRVRQSFPIPVKTPGEFLMNWHR